MQDAVNEIADYPDIALRYQVSDPLILMQLSAQAAMLADLSTQVEVTAGEPFTKARDVTVLADAAVKGILPYATPSIGKLKVTSTGSVALTITAGRSIIDQQGHYWQVITGATIAAGGVGYITAQQVKSRAVSHTVTVNQPFYSVPLDQPDVGYIASIAVTGYTESTDFANINPGEFVYNIKSDDNADLSVQFGMTTVAGYQPPVGTALAITILDTEGALTLATGMKYSFEYAASSQESKLALELSELSQTGTDPMDIATKREICSYPGIYSRSAVYLSNFDFLVRSNIAPVTFLSIWNEAKEEDVRGASLDNINALFIAVRKAGSTDAVMQSTVSALIKKADDSYRHKYVPVVDVVIPLEITLVVPSVYDSAVVEQAVREVLLDQYGPDSAWSQRGEAEILEKDIYDLARDNVTALTERKANLIVTTNGSNAVVLPEHYRYITEDSLVITSTEAS